jgi:hypothetical protein
MRESALRSINVMRGPTLRMQVWMWHSLPPAEEVPPCISACFGTSSGLSSFVLDDGGCPVGLQLGIDPVADGGLKISAALSQTGVSIENIGPIAAVPEPESWAMMLGGLALIAGLAGRRRRRKIRERR